MTDQPDLFAKPAPPRIGDCWLCAGERMCETPDQCYPTQPLPEERRL
jgi:hypothetical protein